MANILWIVIVVLFLVWLAGAFMFVVGPLIHIVLVVAIALLIFNLVTKGKAQI